MFFEIRLEPDGAGDGFLRHFIEHGNDFKFAIGTRIESDFEIGHGGREIGDFKFLVRYTGADDDAARGAGGALRAGPIFWIGNSPNELLRCEENIADDLAAHRNNQQRPAGVFAVDIHRVIEPARDAVRDDFHANCQGIGAAFGFLNCRMDVRGIGVHRFNADGFAVGAFDLNGEVGGRAEAEVADIQRLRVVFKRRDDFDSDCQPRSLVAGVIGGNGNLFFDDAARNADIHRESEIRLFAGGQFIHRERGNGTTARRGRFA